MAQLLAMGEDLLLERLDLLLIFRDRRIHEGLDVEPAGHRLGVGDAVGSERKDFLMVNAGQPIDLLADFLDLAQGGKIEDVAFFDLEHQDQGLGAAELMKAFRQDYVVVLRREEVDEPGGDVYLRRKVRHHQRRGDQRRADRGAKAHYYLANIIDLHR